MLAQHTMILRSLNIRHSLKLPNVASINGIRYKHILAKSSYSSSRSNWHDRQPNYVALTPFTVHGLALRRNFSISTVNRNAATITASGYTLADIPDIPLKPGASIVTETTVAAAENAVTVSLNALGEPTLASLGLGGSTPSGLVQQALETMHIVSGLPWWGTIALTTVIIRFLLTPLVISAQKNSAVFVNSMGEIQALQQKINEARQMKNTLAFAEHSQDLAKLMMEKGYNPLKNILVPFAQMPIFISFYFGIRGMVNVPIESLHQGGAAWFTDLTMADPFYVLPVITCGTLWLTLRSATENAPMSVDAAQNLTMKYMRAMPIFMFPFIMSFPSALVVYWASSNICSLIQTHVFKVPSVRDYFNIPRINPMATPAAVQKQNFIDNATGAWENLKLASEIEDRKRTQQLKLQKDESKSSNSTE